MSKKILVLFVSALALFQLWSKSHFWEFMFKPTLQTADYNFFTNEFRTAATLAGMIILLAITFLSSPTGQNIAKGKYWQGGFWGVLALSFIVVASVNPQGNFPWNKRSQYIEIAARAQKPALYAALENPPDALVFGSSVSFLMPMKYFEARWGLQGFNFSIDGGGMRDFVNQIRWMQAVKPKAKIPAVILVEISNPGLSVDGLKKTPLAQIPYMASPRQQAQTAWAAFLNTLRMSQVADSIFTLRVVDNNRWASAYITDEDGAISLRTEKISRKYYENQVKNNIPVIDTMQFCERLDEEGLRSLQQLAALSREQNFSLVVYRPPINADLYEFSTYTPERYRKCGEAFNEVMQRIADENDNIFYKDLSQYPPVATAGRELYRDTHHLNARGQLLLLDALSREIEAAIQWAKENR